MCGIGIAVVQRLGLMGVSTSVSFSGLQLPYVTVAQHEKRERNLAGQTGQ